MRKIAQVVLIVFFFLESTAQEVFSVEFNNEIQETRVDLEMGSYEFSLDVWLDENSSLDGVEIQINDDTVVKYPFETLEINKWVTLKESFDVENNISNGVIKISMTEDSLFGTGEGVCFFDDVKLIATEKDLSIELYPNPVRDHLKFKCPEGTNIFIYDVLGNRIKQLLDVEKNTDTFLGELPNGLYVIRLEFEGQINTTKLLIKK